MVTVAAGVAVVAAGAVGVSLAGTPHAAGPIVRMPGTIVQANPGWQPDGATLQRPVPPAAPALPAASAAVRLNADFASSDTGAWHSSILQNTDQPAVWLAGNRTVQIAGDVNEDTPLEEAYFLAGQPSWHDVTLEASVFAYSGEGAGLVWNDANGSFYRLQLLPNLPNLAPKARLERVQQGRVTLLASTPAAAYAGYTNAAWQTVRIVSAAGRQQVWVNGGPLFDVHDAALSGGQIGLYAWADSHTRFANVRVQSATSQP